jgi:hypothetical protein
MTFQEVTATAAAVMLSLGGGAAIVVGFSSWLAKIWANRLMMADRLAHEKELDHLRDELRRNSDTALEVLRQKHSSDTDLLMRRRQVYERMARSMRVFFDRGIPATDKEREEFLAAYDESFLWASDDVLHTVGRFLDLNMVSKSLDRAAKSALLQELYRETMDAMRMDAGFPDSDKNKAQYRVVSFGDWATKASADGGMQPPTDG